MHITSRLVLVLLLVSAIPAEAQTTLSWDASTAAGVTGYLVSYGPQSGFYTNTVDVGNSTSWTISGVDPTVDLFFAVRSYGSDGSVSPYSDETELPAAVPSSGTTVLSSLLSSVAYPILPGQSVTWTASATDSAGPVEYAFWMFSQSAGWMKVQDYSPSPSFTWTPASSDLGTHWLEVWARTVGSSATYETWMASGLFDVGTSSAYDSYSDSSSTGSSTGSSTTTSTTSSSSAGCTTPDPFASLGGGTCVDGGWLPPGMGGTSTSSTSTSSTTSSTTTTSSAGCTTPDPFMSIGGGTCVNGGWIPGGMTAGTSSSTSTSSSGSTGSGATTSNTSTVTTGCITPDPFMSIGGGTCVNGGWIPGGSGSTGSTTTSSTSNTTSSSTTSSGTSSGSSGGCTIADPFMSIGGGTCVNGGWVPGHVSTGSTTSTSGGTTTNTSNNGQTTTTQQSTFGGCTTPDPFVSIGGGICINGGWVPKG